MGKILIGLTIVIIIALIISVMAKFPTESTIGIGILVIIMIGYWIKDIEV